MELKLAQRQGTVPVRLVTGNDMQAANSLTLELLTHVPFLRLWNRYPYKLFLVILSVFVISLCFFFWSSRRKNYCL